MFHFEQVAGMVAVHALMLLGATPAWAGRGDIDPNYGEGGRLAIGCCAPVLALPDDRLVIGEPTAEGFRVRMVDANGQNVADFGDGGVVLINSSAALAFQPESAILAPNGDMIFAGWPFSPEDIGAHELLRLDQDGQPVLSFGDRGDGFVEPTIATPQAVATGQGMVFAIDPDGRIVLAESSWNLDGSCGSAARLQRLLANGQPDAGFGGGAIVEIPDLDICNGASVFGARTEGGVIVGDGHTIVAVDAAGDIDPTFGVDGRLTVTEFASARGLLLPDGDLLIFGSSAESASWNDTVFMKFDRHGQPDLAFGSGSGSVTVDLGTALLGEPSTHEVVDQLALDPDGEHVVAQMSFSRVDGTLACAGIARLTIDGTPDTTFGRNGLTCLNFYSGVITVQSDGAPLIFLAYHDYVGRFLPNDSPSPGILRVLDQPNMSITESEGFVSAAVERVAGRDGPVNVTYATSGARSCSSHQVPCSDNSATADSDYTAASGQLDWADGEDGQRTVTVRILDDDVDEDTEYFAVGFSDPPGGTQLIGATTFGSIIDDDTSAPPPPPGGGGSVSWMGLLALLALLVIRPRRDQRAVAWIAALPGFLLLVSTAAWAGRGDIDPNYGEGGALTIGSYVVIGLPDDRMAILGQDSVSVADSNGRPVSSFGDQGQVVIPLPAGMARFEAYAGTAGPHGQVLFYGALSDGAYSQRYEAIYLLDAAGHSNSAFGGNDDGFFRLTGESNADGVTPFTYVASGLDPVGRIVLLERTVSDENPCAGPAHLRRLLPNGDLDGSFGIGGTVELGTLEPCAIGSTFGVRADASIVVGSGPDIVSINASGQIDAAFGEAGQLSAGIPNCCAGFLLPDGGLLLLGSVEGADGSTDTALKKFQRNGEPDSSFGSGTGSITFDLANEFGGAPGSDGFMERLLPSPDGSGFVVQLSASEVDSFQKCYGIAKLTSDGRPDVGFGDHGLTCLSFGSYRFDLVSVQQDGAPIFAIWAPHGGPMVSGYRLLADATPSPGLITLVGSRAAEESAGITTVAEFARVAGRDGAASADFTTASRPSCHIRYVCLWDSATTNSDYAATSGQLDWADLDDSSRTVTVSILDDDLVEYREVFGIDISNPSGGVQLIGASATIGISDNDSAPPPPPPPPPPTSPTGGGGSISWAPLLALLTLLFIRRRRFDTVAACALFGPLLAALLTACEGPSSSPAKTPPATMTPITASARGDSAQLGFTCVYFEKPTPTQPNTRPEADYRSTPTLAFADDIDYWPPVGRLPLLATGARPASVDPGGVNEIDVEERKVVTVAVATMTDALQRGLVGGPGHGAGLRGGTFRVARGPQLTLTLVDCAYTADVTVSGLVTWAHSDIFGSGGFLAVDRPLTADLIVSGPGTAGGTLHVAGSWLSKDPNGFFNVTGTLGQKKVAVLVPKA